MCRVLSGIKQYIALIKEPLTFNVSLSSRASSDKLKHTLIKSFYKNGIKTVLSERTLLELCNFSSVYS